ANCTLTSAASASFTAPVIWICWPARRWRCSSSSGWPLCPERPPLRSERDHHLAESPTRQMVQCGGQFAGGVGGGDGGLEPGHVDRPHQVFQGAAVSDVDALQRGL